MAVKVPETVDPDVVLNFGLCSCGPSFNQIHITLIWTADMLMCVMYKRLNILFAISIKLSQTVCIFVAQNHKSHNSLRSQTQQLRLMGTVVFRVIWCCSEDVSRKLAHKYANVTHETIHTTKQSHMSPPPSFGLHPNTIKVQSWACQTNHISQSEARIKL